MSLGSLRLVLASASPARRGLLLGAGIEPEVRVSSVDEDAVTATLAIRTAPVIAQELAAAKARDVAQQLDLQDAAGTLVLGCDSVLEFEGEVLGKPRDVDDVRRRLRNQRGGTGTLFTGHTLIDCSTGRTAHAVAGTTVNFGTPTDDELDAYIETGEPLAVAGAFTLDGYSAPFIESIEGDHSNVIGLSLPALRRLVIELDHSYPQLWSRSVT